MTQPDEDEVVGDGWRARFAAQDAERERTREDTLAAQAVVDTALSAASSDERADPYNPKVAHSM